eukprot:SAG11_NODE_2270_length_3595_cov_15.410755_1_plen_693_part_00
MDIAALAAFDIDPALKQFIGSMYEEFQADKAALRADLQGQLNDERRKNEAQRKENQLQAGQIAALQAALHEFSNKTRAEASQLKANVQNITVRLDQCEAETAPFAAMMNRRRIQEDTLCRGSGLTAMFQACCPSRSSMGNGHRILQLSEGCDALPQTCSASCAPLFIEYFEGCQGMLDDLAPDQRQMFVGFYGGCQEVEQAAAAMLEDARPAMIFHVVVMSEAEAQQAQMFGGGNAPAPPIGPIGPLPPSPSPAGGAEIAQEFRRVCTTANLTVCVPQCNRLTYGFLLSIEIDGRGTVMTCNVMDMLYAWVGQASLGGYIGAVFEAFFSSVISGAAGTYMVKITKNQTVHTDLTIEPGQVVVINGDQALPQPPTWGSGSFMVGESASLSLSYMQIDTVIQMNHGALVLSLDSCLLTFDDTMVLRAASVTFLNQIFQGGVQVPNEASVSITGALTFAASLRTAGLTVQSGGTASLTSTALATSGNDDMLVVRVDGGGRFSVQGSTLVRADGSSDPLPCDGDLASQTCTSGHDGETRMDGPIEIRANSPLVCTEAGCFTISCPELTYSGSGYGSQTGIVSYDNDARIYTAGFQTTATYSCSGGRAAPVLAGGSATRTCQVDGTWSDAPPAQPCLPCCSVPGRRDVWSQHGCPQCSSGCQYCERDCTSYSLWNTEPHGRENICPYCCRGWCDGTC